MSQRFKRVVVGIGVALGLLLVGGAVVAKVVDRPDAVQRYIDAHKAQWRSDCEGGIEHLSGRVGAGVAESTDAAVDTCVRLMEASARSNRQTSEATAPSGAPPAELGGAVASDRFGVPVPAGAVRVDRSSSGDSTLYRTPPSISLADLDRWYQAHMPIGRPWSGHAWCEAARNTSAVTFSWRQQNPGDFIIVLLSPPSGATGGAVSVMDDRSDSPDCSGAV